MEGKHNYNYENKEGSKSNNFAESEAKELEDITGYSPNQKDKKIFE